MILIKNYNYEELKDIIDKKLSQFNRENCQWLNNNSGMNQEEYEEKEYNFLSIPMTN